MDQLGSWASYFAAVMFGLVAWAINNDWSLFTILLLVTALAGTWAVIGPFFQSGR